MASSPDGVGGGEVGEAVSVAVEVSDGSGVMVLVGVAGSGEGVSVGGRNVAVGGIGVAVAGWEVSVGEGVASSCGPDAQPVTSPAAVIITTNIFPARQSKR